jgi:Ni/Co efflux regulator RcnB
MRNVSKPLISMLAASIFCAGAMAAPASAAPPSKMQKEKAKESKADMSADVNTDRDVIQSLEHAKKALEGEKVKDKTGHRAQAILYVQKAMGEIRSKTSKPGH